MILKRKIAAWIVATILSIPALMLFNDSEETVYINIIGFVYCWIIYKTARYFLPKWMYDYFTEEPKDKF